MVRTRTKNTLKPEPAVEKPKKERKPMGRFRVLNQKVNVGGSLHSIVDGSFLTRNNLVQQIRFILFLTLIGVFYIANSYNSEKTIIEISRIKRELEELRFEHITTKSNLMFHSKQSEVAVKLKNTGVKESLVPPVKIYVKEK